MNRPPTTAAVLAILALMLLTGCFQRVDRIDFANLGVPPTLETPLPTNTLVVLPTPTPTKAPTPEPTPTPVAPTPVPERGSFLEIHEPDEGTTVRSRNVTVIGSTNVGNVVEVNGRRIDVDQQGNFTTEANLSEGVNVVEVLATTPLGEQRRGFVTVVYIRPTPSPFFLRVPEPPDGTVFANPTIRVSGITIPQASVSVNGVGVFVDEDGNFSTMISLNPGSNTIAVLARNTDGQTLRINRTVDYAGAS